MKLLTNFFSSAATKFPVTTIIVILGITGFFGYMTTQAEELDTGFGGEIDTPEIEAQGKLSDYFGGSGTQSVLQLVFEGEDVLTVEGYETYTASVEVIKNSELYQYFQSHHLAQVILYLIHFLVLVELQKLPQIHIHLE